MRQTDRQSNRQTDRMAYNQEEHAEQSWQEFTQETSMHGIKYIHMSTSSKIRRGMWLIFTVICIGYFCYAAGTFLHDCSQKLLMTNIRVEQTSTIKFPTVTICNQNMFSDAYVKAVEQGMGSNALSTILTDLYNPDPQLPPPPEKYSIDDPKYEFFYTMTGEDSERFMRTAAHPLELTFNSCKIFGKITTCSDLFDVVPTNAGFCFQFNGNGSMNATTAGKTGGVEITLNTRTDLYSAGQNSASEGFSITFHDAHEFPLVEELGIGLAPGMQSSIVLHKSGTKRFPPWADGGRANCFDTVNLPNPLRYFSNYSRSGCQAECLATYVINKCGCNYPALPAVDSSSVCTLIEMLYCSQPALLEFPSDKEGLASCVCPDPCVASEYSAKISSYRFPSTNYMKQTNTSEERIEYMRKNFLVVNIFFGKMFYTTLEETLAYGFMEAMSNVGGTLGLCIGASLLTVFEFVQFGILSIIRCLELISKKEKGSVVKVKPVHDFD